MIHIKNYMPEDIRNPKISVVIPVYNESLNIESIISATVKALEKIDLPYEIIVVDDGSADMTGEIARDCGAHVIQNRRNFGKGHALRSGFRMAKGDVIVTIDADFTSNPQEIEKLVLPLMRGTDIVFGTRFSEKSNVRPYASSRIHRLGNKSFDSSDDRQIHNRQPNIIQGI
jgi:glycosyltransferase involved in cell wall biosynthesis